MAFASSETIRDKFQACIQPYRKSRVQHAAYELSLGAEVITTSDGTLRVLDPVPEGEEEGGHINIEPGQLAMLITEEVVAIPTGYLGFISIKASIKLSGLVNISGFHVDPGFVGRLKFSVYNAGSDPIPLRRGQPTFLLWFAELDQTTEDAYDGKHKLQRHISSKDIESIQGELASPAALVEQIRQLEGKFEKRVGGVDSTLGAKLTSLEAEVGRLRAFFFGVVGSLIVGGVLLALQIIFGGRNSDPPQGPTVVYPPGTAIEEVEADTEGNAAGSDADLDTPIPR